jgi:nitroimidazol reductase NimA-like FMN-containing flavoprotein (pyridoxamine 5'-phosphate oxidase superfamily)
MTRDAMPADAPVSAQLLIPANAGAPVIPWAEARSRLAEAFTYWLATVHPDGRPQIRPVLAVWVAGALHTTTSPAARKGRNLAGNPRCSLAVHGDGLDLVVEGTMAKVTDQARLHPVAEAYATKYGWPVSVRGGAFHAEGAPTAGPPPYAVYQVIPVVVFGFGTEDDRYGPRSTRWDFVQAR